MSNVFGRGVGWLIICANSFGNLNIGAFRQFALGRIGWLGLWVYMKPFMVGAEELISSISTWNLVV